ncbi:uncharacterized protein EI90DRAFT_3032903 [Cantharellus anzutake]|uniref:uncharacterized protein n=1 Tax=Cantharellus anzutake TaxID=1750568 RepID=UPI001904BB05|nr:uncharacterized protein EI90DRAFT_3032903 [Cantharellus anzutake]KAF8342327.1 hypothetical protein EI90DRAFT_3032903 [Cantharellus anzutake]
MNGAKSSHTLKDIHDLPPEIIREIFLIGLASSNAYQDIKYRIAISSVSHLWRSFALEEPRFWSDVSISLRWPVSRVYGATDQQSGDGPDHVAVLSRASVWLRRSKNAPLHLTLMLYNVPLVVQREVRELVAPHFYRVKTLSLRLHQYAYNVELKKLWLPLPDSVGSLRALELQLLIGDDYPDDPIELGPPLTLRRFVFDTCTPPNRIFLSKFEVSEKLSLNDVCSQSIINIFERCPDVKCLELSGIPCPRFFMYPPSPQFSIIDERQPVRWSFASLHRLSIHKLHHSLIEAAPNLKHLQFHEITPEIVWKPTSVDTLSGLEVIRARDMDQIITLASGCLVSSQNLKAIGLSLRFPRPVYNPAPLFSQSVAPFLSETVQDDIRSQISRPPPFPGLKLLVMDISLHKRGMVCVDVNENSLPVYVEKLLRMRPGMVLVFRVPRYVKESLQDLSKLMPDRFVIDCDLIEMDDLVERYIR